MQKPKEFKGVVAISYSYDLVNHEYEVYSIRKTDPIKPFDLIEKQAYDKAIDVLASIRSITQECVDNKGYEYWLDKAVCLCGETLKELGELNETN